MTPVTDQVKKQVLLRAPQSRVWKALTSASEFSAWFDIQLQGEFAEGKSLKGTFTRAMNEAKIMEYQRKNGIQPSKIRMPDEHRIFCTVERIQPEDYFSYRWIPYGIDAEADPENEPTTLVEFRLEKVAEGTMLTITESGFDQVPAHRRERAFRMNDGGWTGQAENIKKYVESK
jgi:uncharacterized protein YndB with AHSA1/START domain